MAKMLRYTFGRADIAQRIETAVPRCSQRSGQATLRFSEHVVGTQAMVTPSLLVVAKFSNNVMTMTCSM